MSQLTDNLAAVMQAVTELEDQLRGSSPLQARLEKDKADLEELAKTIEASLTSINEREKIMIGREQAVAERELKMDDREAKFEEAKAALKASSKK